MPAQPKDILTLVRLQLGQTEVRPEQRLAEDLRAESADVANIVAAAEEKWDIRVSDQEIAELHTVADLIALVQRHT